MPPLEMPNSVDIAACESELLLAMDTTSDLLTAQLKRDLVAVEAIKVSEVTTESGLIIPLDAYRRTGEGVVRNTGPLCKQLKPGDSVLFPDLEVVPPIATDGDVSLFSEGDILLTVEAVSAPA